MSPYQPLSPKVEYVLSVLEGMRRERAAMEQMCEYTRDDEVESSNLESRGGPPLVLNPPEAGRSASSRLSR